MGLNFSASTNEDQTVHQNRFELTSSKTHLECIEALRQCGFIRALSTSGLCSHLVSLNLNLESTDASRGIVSQLKGIPSLKILGLSNMPISIEDCEMVHDNLPLSTTPKLLTDEFLENATSLNKSPAYTITTFEIRGFSYDLDQKIHIDWLQYISKKYPNLMHFGYFMDIVESSGRKSEETRQQDYLTALNSICSTLKSLDTSAVDENNVCTDLNSSVYKKFAAENLRI